MKERLYRNDQSGLTLVEVLAAMTVFALVTVGIIPLLMSSVRGAAVSRTYTVGKNVALQGMERARGLPYFIDYATQQGYSNNVPPFRKVDLLDIYFPRYVASGVYVTTCGAGTVDPACPTRVPDGYSLEFRARFVTPRKTLDGAREVYDTVLPATTYRWDPDPYTAVDHPPSQMLELVVTSRWEFGGRQRSFEFGTVIADRKFGEVTVRGDASVDYTVRVTTNYVDSAGAETQLQGLGGISESRVETKTASTADQASRAAQLRLVEIPGDPTLTGTELDRVEGATSVHHAPPDSVPSGTTAGAQDLVHPELGAIAGVDATLTRDLKVSVSSELPTSEGTSSYSAPTGLERLFWATAQIDAATGANLHLDPTAALLSFAARPGATLSTSTSAETIPVSDPGRRVATGAAASFGRLRLLPTAFIADLVGLDDDDGDLLPEASVVRIDDFEASVDCRSTASTGSNAAAATTSWSATLLYWRDAQNDRVPAGSYQSVALSSANASDPLQAIGPGDTNPLVYDGVSRRQDVYLFEEEDRRGYLRSWSSLVGTTTSVDEAGRVTRADIDGAIRINTVEMDPDNPASGVAVQVGKLSCEAVDQR